MLYSQKYTPPHCFFCNFAGWRIFFFEIRNWNIISLIIHTTVSLGSGDGSFGGSGSIISVGWSDEPV